MRLPPPLSWFYEAWMEFSKALGKVMSFIILTILWIVGFGIYGIALKVAAMVRRDGPRESYWLDVEPRTEAHLTQQF